MSIQIIGTGQGRTGTNSLKLALEQIDFGKCYHMAELFQHPDDLAYFETAEKGEAVDWDKLFEGYHSAVDYPVVRYYKQLIAKYPDAKVIHTTRDAESWYNSAVKTILWASKPSFGRIVNLTVRLPFSAALRKKFPILKFNGRLVDNVYGKNIHDKKTVIEKFNRFNEEVLDTVPKERMLIYDVKEGWEPLCSFLNVPVPATPFPKTNNMDEFIQRVGRLSKGKDIGDSF